jgi:hypothetical protein
MMMKPIPESVKNEIRAELKKTKMGQPWEDIFFRLFTLTSTPEEAKRWKQLKILYRGQVHMAPEEMGNFELTLILWKLTYVGIINRRCVNDRGDKK